MTNNIPKLIFCLLIFASTGVAAGDQATVKIKAVDDAGKPVADANIAVDFEAYQSANNMRIEAKTDANGKVEVKGWPKTKFMAAISLAADTPGYYVSRLDSGAGPSQLVDGYVWNAQILLRKKETPIPMYAKKVELELPEVRREVGFDFEKADWVKPFGQGEVADCTFIGIKAYEDRDNFKTSVVMSFPGQKEGLLVDPLTGDESVKLSAFKTSRAAPLEGYQGVTEFVFKKSTARRYEGSTDETNYIFRSRTALDESGELKSSRYGKLINAVSVSSGSGLPDTKPIVSFTYYFNPTPNDRNLEFDPEQNLFPSPDGNLEVWHP